MNIGHLPALGYHQVRLSHCRRALRELAHRWTAQIVVGLAVLGAAAPALAALVAMPLLRAFSEGAAWLWVAPLYAGVSLAWLIVAEPWLWGRELRNAECLVPVTKGALFRSDLRVGAGALIPWSALLLAGTVAVLSARPPWWQGEPWAALLGVVSPVGIGVGLWALRLQRLRHRLRDPAIRFARQYSSRAAPAALPAVGLMRAEFWWRLARGRAPWTRRMLLTSLVLPQCLTVAALLWPERATAFVLIHALAGVTLLRAACGFLEREWSVPQQDLSVWPVSAGKFMFHARMRVVLVSTIAMLPLMLGIAQRELPRPGLLSAYVLASVATWLFLTQVRPREPTDAAALGLFCTVALAALASEVV